MAALNAYMAALRKLTRSIGKKLGTDLSLLPKEQRIGNIASIAAVASLIKLLVDKGILSEPEVRKSIKDTDEDVWPEEKIWPNPEEEEEE